MLELLAVRALFNCCVSDLPLELQMVYRLLASPLLTP